MKLKMVLDNVHYFSRNALPDTQEEDGIANTNRKRRSYNILWVRRHGAAEQLIHSTHRLRPLLSIGFCTVSLQSFPSIAFYYERKEEVKLLFLLSYLSSFILYEDSNNFKRYDNFRKKPKDTKWLNWEQKTRPSQ